MDSQQILKQINQNPYVIIPLSIWIVCWKALALWKASKKNDKIWFGIILVLNSLGLVEIVYYFLVSKYDKFSFNKKKK